MSELLGRVPAVRVATVLLVLGGLALLWTGWSGRLSGLLVTVGLLVAGGFVALAVHRFEEQR